jgi:hypothetical protein
MTPETRTLDAGLAASQDWVVASRFQAGALALAALVLSAMFGAGCGSNAREASNGPALIRPFSASEVIAAFGRHHLKVERFARATNCPPVCTTTGGVPLASDELQFAGSKHAFVFDVLLYRIAAEAERVISPALLRDGKNLLRVRIRYLRRGNVVVTYVGHLGRDPLEEISEEMRWLRDGTPPA